ncbi:MAG: hypothetical protein ABEK59_13110 [Halobacteria archaeon]
MGPGYKHHDSEQERTQDQTYHLPTVQTAVDVKSGISVIAISGSGHPPGLLLSAVRNEFFSKFSFFRRQIRVIEKSSRPHFESSSRPVIEIPAVFPRFTKKA